MDTTAKRKCYISKYLAIFSGCRHSNLFNQRVKMYYHICAFLQITELEVSKQIEAIQKKVFLTRYLTETEVGPKISTNHRSNTIQILDLNVNNKLLIIYLSDLVHWRCWSPPWKVLENFYPKVPQRQLQQYPKFI